MSMCLSELLGVKKGAVNIFFYLESYASLVRRF